MIQSHLDLARSRAVVRSEQALDVLQSDPGPEEQAAALFALCDWHRALAIAALLQECDVDEWTLHLRASAQAQLELRERAKSGAAMPPEFLCGSKNIGLSAALVAGDLGIARKLAAISPSQHNPNLEYEDDFLFFHFLGAALTHPDRPSPELSSIVSRWEEVLKGGESSALEVCRTLSAPDAGGFGDAFDALLATRDDKLEEYRAQPTCDPKDFATEGRVFIDGLALLRLADLQGIETAREYRYIPAVARVPENDYASTDTLWRQLPS